MIQKKKKKILKLSKKERDALKTLLEREDIILTKADKRGAVVIINVDYYVKEANQTTPHFVKRYQMTQKNYIEPRSILVTKN